MTGTKQLGATGTWTELFRAGHSHSAELIYTVLENENYALGGAYGHARISSRYGAAQILDHIYNLGAMNGGNISGNAPGLQYLNNGGTYNYLWRMLFSYTGSSPFVIHWTVKGHFSDRLIAI